MRSVTARERHASTTALNISVAFKLTVGRFINSSILLVIIHSGHGGIWFEEGQLAAQASVLIILMALSNPIVYVIDPAGLIKKVQKYLEQRKGEDCKMTQREANALCEGTKLDVANNLSAYFAMILTCMFFSPIIPLAIPIACLGSFMHYYAYKYMILRKHKQPEMMSSQLATFFTNSMPYIGFMWAVGFYTFMTVLFDTYKKEERYKKYIKDNVKMMKSAKGGVDDNQTMTPAAFTLSLFATCIACCCIMCPWRSWLDRRRE